MEAACFSGQRKGQVTYADDGPETFRQSASSVRYFFAGAPIPDFRLAQRKRYGRETGGVAGSASPQLS
jgi:hypothetical protein